jgi:hypothetical protein
LQIGFAPGPEFQQLNRRVKTAGRPAPSFHGLVSATSKGRGKTFSSYRSFAAFLLKDLLDLRYFGRIYFN